MSPCHSCHGALSHRRLATTGGLLSHCAGGKCEHETQSSAWRLAAAELESLGASARALTTKPSLAVLHVPSDGFQSIPLPARDPLPAAFLRLLRGVSPETLPLSAA